LLPLHFLTLNSSRDKPLPTCTPNQPYQTKQSGKNIFLGRSKIAFFGTVIVILVVPTNFLDAECFMGYFIIQLVLPEEEIPVR